MLSVCLALWCGLAPAMGARAADEEPRGAGGGVASPDGAHADPMIERIRSEADALAPLVGSDAGRLFLSAARELPAVASRVIYYDPQSRRAWTEEEARRVHDEAQRESLRRIEVDTKFYYDTRFGSPLAYVRALDLAGENGFVLNPGSRIMDFGYGSIGQLRTLASLGADVTGVEVSELIHTIYSEPGDTGAVPAAASLPESHRARMRHPGRIKLVLGQWPTTDAIRAEVGGRYDLITSKNTLKRGYIHPEREVDPRMLVHLGVDDDVYVRRVFEALKPGGLFVIYNLSPAHAPADKPYIPWADGRCPFDRELLERTGFEVLAYDMEDSHAARRLGEALGWGASMDLEHDLFGMYTIVRRPSR